MDRNDFTAWAVQSPTCQAMGGFGCRTLSGRGPGIQPMQLFFLFSASHVLYVSRKPLSSFHSPSTVHRRAS